MATGAALFLRDPSTHHGISQRWWSLFGAGLLGLGFLVQLAGQLSR
jgi:hypothetical protein